MIKSDQPLSPVAKYTLVKLVFKSFLCGSELGDSPGQDTKGRQNPQSTG